MTEEILRRPPARESAARTYPHALPIVPVRARGLTIEGADGRRYLDCLSGAGTLALGHNHPVVLAAIREVLDSGAPLHVPDLTTPVEDAFVTELLRTLPPGLADHARVRFCGPTGADALATAYALARAATGRTAVLTFAGADHGPGAETLKTSSTAIGLTDRPLPYPQDYRCPFGVGGPHGAELAGQWAEAVLNGADPAVPFPGDPAVPFPADPGAPAPSAALGAPAISPSAAPLAGMILEPVQGEEGVIPAPDEWMRRMRHLTAARSVPLIVDESQTGVGRTGTFWAVEHSGVTPDVMILSKAIGGSLPLAAVVHRDDLLDADAPDAHAGPFRGNQLAMAAGAATLAHVRHHRLAERAATLGARLLKQLRVLRTEFAYVGDVRGRGLMIGVELVDPEAEADTAAGAEAESRAARDGSGPSSVAAWGGGLAGVPLPHSSSDDATRTATGPFSARSPRPPAPHLASAVQRECLRRGLIVGLGGRNTSVVRLLPPLTISDEQVAAVLDRLADALAAVAPAHTGRRQPRRDGDRQRNEEGRRRGEAQSQGHGRHRDPQHRPDQRCQEPGDSAGRAR